MPKRRRVIYGNYVGPGNPVDPDYVDEYPPIDEFDRAAYRHDVEYTGLGKRAYTHYSDADEQFVREIDVVTPGSVYGRGVKMAAQAFFTAKNSVLRAFQSPLKRSRRSLDLRSPQKEPAVVLKNEVDPVSHSDNLITMVNYNNYIGKSVHTSRRVGPSVYEKYGSAGTDEVYGATSDPNVAYLAVSSLKTPIPKDSPGGTYPIGPTTNAFSVSGSVLYHIAAAWLRDELYRQYRHQVMDQNDPLSFVRINSQNQNVGVENDKAPVIHFIGRRCDDQSGVEVRFEHIYTLFFLQKSNQTYQRIKTFYEVACEIAGAVFMHYKAGGWTQNDGSDWRLYAWQWVDPDLSPASDAPGGATTSALQRSAGGRIQPVQYFDNLFLKAYSTSAVTFQNATTADNTEGDEYVANRIDSNPLECAVYRFSTPTPRVKIPRMYYYPPVFNQALENGATVNETNTELNVTNPPVYVSIYDNPQSRSSSVLHGDGAFLQYDDDGNGIVLPGTQFNTSGDWKRLPPTSKFTSCTSEGRFALRPGEMKTSYLKFKFDGTIPNFLKKMRKGHAELTPVAATNTSPASVSVNYIYGPEGTSSLSTDQLGTCQLFAFQKYMSLRSITPAVPVEVKVNFQVVFSAGAFVTKHRRSVLPRINLDQMFNAVNETEPIDPDVTGDEVMIDSSNSGGNPI